MAGHNKWSSIKHKKAKTDAQRGKLFSKVAREIMMAARLGGADVGMNPRLRLALQKAKEANMPNDNVNRAIQKGAGNGDGVQLEELQFEAYGPHGVAMLIDVLTDNRNRSVANIKLIVNKGGGNMAQKGAVGYMFALKGVVYFSAHNKVETIMDMAVELGAEDVDVDTDGGIEIVAPVDVLESLREAYDNAGFEYETARVSKLASTRVSLSQDQFVNIEQLVEALEEDDDVQDVYTNVG